MIGTQIHRSSKFPQMGFMMVDVPTDKLLLMADRARNCFTGTEYRQSSKDHKQKPEPCHYIQQTVLVQLGLKSVSRPENLDAAP